MNRISQWLHLLDRTLYLVLAGLSLTVAFLLRFDSSPPRRMVPLLWLALCATVVIKPVVFHYAGFHKGWRQYFDVHDLLCIIGGNVIASALFTVTVLLTIGEPFPRSVYLIDFAFTLLLTTAARFSVQLLREAILAERSYPQSRRILIHGVCEAAIALLRETRSNPSSGYEVIGFLDDDPANSHQRLMGAPVLGTSRDAALIVDRLKKAHKPVDEIVIAIHSNGRQLGEVLANCRACGVACKTLPPLTELLSTTRLSDNIRNVCLTDLLGREPVHLDKARIHSSIVGRSILVTGAAGSIGSELCRQLAQYGPSRLIALDQAESDLYRLECELASQFRGMELISQLGDIRDLDLLYEVVQRFSVDSIFHAAAYKHVPMMERHVLEAVRNNVLGTWNLLRAACHNGVSNFLMISSDKAVNPTSVMGSTKRVCELLVSSVPTSDFDHVPACVSVRFGNVLGSSGSVVPLFQMQINTGGPVRVTHPEMRRYFMTIPEAVMLVLQASTMGKGSEVFVLDMGKPMRIVELAENMIYAAGLVPYKDIEIQFTGLRPGEKLYEELGLSGERILPTYHEKIKIFADPVQRWVCMEEWIQELEHILQERRAAAVVAHLKDLVPEYQPSPTWSSEASEVPENMSARGN